MANAAQQNPLFQVFSGYDPLVTPLINTITKHFTYENQGNTYISQLAMNQLQPLGISHTPMNGGLTRTVNLNLEQAKTFDFNVAKLTTYLKQDLLKQAERTKEDIEAVLNPFDSKTQKSVKMAEDRVNERLPHTQRVSFQNQIHRLAPERIAQLRKVKEFAENLLKNNSLLNNSSLAKNNSLQAPWYKRPLTYVATALSTAVAVGSYFLYHYLQNTATLPTA